MKKSVVAAVLALVAAGSPVGCEEKQAPPAPKESTPMTSASTSAMDRVDTKMAKEPPVTSANAEAVKAYRAGVDFDDNLRSKEATEAFKKAVALDPKFYSASAAVGELSPGKEGDKLIAAAVAAGTGLPEAERIHLQLSAARHAGDRAKAVELAKSYAELLPMAWHAQYEAASALRLSGKLKEAKPYYKKATDLDPMAAAPHNDLGYLALMTGDSDEAVAQLKKYAELRPKEANPHDSYGEALLLAGKYDESEAEFKKALALDPNFVIANEGIGFDYLYKGDYAKANDAFGKLRDAKDADWNDASGAYGGIAWGQLAQNKFADAMKTVDAWDVAATQAMDTDASIRIALARASLTLEGGKPADAIKLLTTIGENIDKAEAPAARKARWHTLQHTFEAVGYNRLAKVAEADKARAAVEELAAKSEDEDLKSNLAIARGAAAMAKGDAAAAVAAMKDCAIYQTECVYERMKAAEKAGQKDAAAADKAILQKNHPRNGAAFFLWKQNPPAANPK